jgi:uncharacterized membrane protein YqjE
MTCFWIVRATKAWMLLTIILANMGYCLVSGAVVIAFDSLTRWGRVLLMAEILVIIGVVMIEWSVYRKSFRS